MMRAIRFKVVNVTLCAACWFWAPWSSTPAPASAEAAQQEITLKLVSFQPVNFALNTHLKKFVQQVNERGAGKVKIDFLAGRRFRPPLRTSGPPPKGSSTWSSTR
jgi:TRAP-type C4-dicarboxylate transport system substrate-binding protein